MPLDFLTLAKQCTPQISPITMAAVVRTESDFNPYAIGVVRGQLLRQPSSEAEAIATVRALEANGWRFSAGIAQINRANWSRYGLTERNVFDPCRNLATGAAILMDCFTSARRAYVHPQTALRASFSCYASGNFSAGYRTGYVQRVVNSARQPVPTVLDTVPAIAPIPVVSGTPDASVARVRPKTGIYRPDQPDRSETPSGELGGDQVRSAVVF
ncbi:lytic transglycosylase, catalytic [Burkholderia lata]|uniref:Lytic transglycosylase, catalytic n=1 Tax=Burkholderia lata (strain ATCC 17760 / DSM 23089 / LMG 22485 / NCIMB 9086 / R18194 / 383) TaxID=482957 RepID=A0A6P2L3L4_BURL3|nr:lytic transglycosylase, catalytic [Burkholderia lata]